MPETNKKAHLIYISRRAVLGHGLNYQTLTDLIKGDQEKINVVQWNAQQANWVDEVLRLEKGTINTVMIPSFWLLDLPEEIPERFLKLIQSGQVRIAYFGKKSDKGNFEFPAFNIPSDRGIDVLHSMVKLVGEASFTGIHCFFPPTTKIVSTRPAISMPDMKEPLDKVFKYYGSRAPQVGEHKIKINIAMRAIVKFAFEEDPKPENVKIKVAFSNDLFAFSVKWKTNILDYKEWVKKNPQWDNITPTCTGLWFNLLPISEEVEATALYFLGENMEETLPQITNAYPLGINIFGKNRIDPNLQLDPDPKAFDDAVFSITEKTMPKIEETLEARVIDRYEKDDILGVIKVQGLNDDCVLGIVKADEFPDSDILGTIKADAIEGDDILGRYKVEQIEGDDVLGIVKINPIEGDDILGSVKVDQIEGDDILGSIKVEKEAQDEILARYKVDKATGNEVLGTVKANKEVGDEVLGTVQVDRKIEDGVLGTVKGEGLFEGDDILGTVKVEREEKDGILAKYKVDQVEGNDVVATFKGDGSEKDEVLANIKGDGQEGDEVLGRIKGENRDGEDVLARIKQDNVEKDEVLANIKGDGKEEDGVFGTVKIEREEKDGILAKYKVDKATGNEVLATIKGDQEDGDDILGTVKIDGEEKDEILGTIKGDGPQKDEILATIKGEKDQGDGILGTVSGDGEEKDGVLGVVKGEGALGSEDDVVATFKENRVIKEEVHVIKGSKNDRIIDTKQVAKIKTEKIKGELVSKPKDNINLLLVGEDEENLVYLSEVFLKLKIKIFTTTSSSKATQLLKNQKFGCVVTCMELEKGNAEFVVNKVRSDRNGANYKAPIILIMNSTDMEALKKLKKNINGVVSSKVTSKELFDKFKKACPALFKTLKRKKAG
jgi:CheY-like chemotaxis protein